MPIARSWARGALASSLISCLVALCAPAVALGQTPVADPAQGLATPQASPATSPPTPANDGGYTPIDRATVRVFAARSVRMKTLAGSRYQRQIALPESSHGSGVVINADGVILTAQHVVDGARQISVRLPGDGGALPASVVYQDRERDFAILVVSPRPTDFVPLDADARVTVRQQVHAIGYPLDARRTQPQSSRGIISGWLEDGGVQLDMALNPGNSGGPLIDAQERVIGIVVARGDVEQGIQNLGFAVPLRPMAEALARPEIVSAIAAARGDLAANAERHARTAQVLDSLVQLGGAEVFYELDDMLEGTTTSPERLARLEEVSEGTTEPLLALMLAAYFWDASIIILEESGGAYAPSDMPTGERRALAERLQARARALVETANGTDAELTASSGMLSALGVGGGASGWGAPGQAYRAPVAEAREPKRTGHAFFQLGGGLGPVSLAVADGGNMGVAFAAHIFGRLVLATTAKAPVRAGLTLGAHVVGGGRGAFDYRSAYAALFQGELGAMVGFGRRIRLTLGYRWLPGAAFFGKDYAERSASAPLLRSMRGDISVGSDRITGGVSVLTARAQSTGGAPWFRLIAPQLFLAMGW